jgi:hypothetical protein
VPSPKCKTCGLVNFASAQVCQRCSTPLAEHEATGDDKKEPPRTQRAAVAPQGDTAPASILLKPETINGMGVDLRDYRKLSDDTYQVTRCFTLLWVPLIPISVWVVRPVSRELSYLTAAEFHNFELLEDRPLDLVSVLRVYGLFLLWVALAFGPFLLALLLMDHDRGRYGEHQPGGFSVTLFLLAMPWCIGFIMWLKRRRDRLYTLVNKSPVARALGVR